MARCYCTTLRRATRKLTALYDEALEPTGVTVAQFSLLRAIQRTAPVSLTDLGRKTELDRSTIGRNTKVLERMGLVGTIQAKDGRESALALTGIGAGVLETAAPLWEAAQQRVETAIGEDGVATLSGILHAL